MNAKTTATRSRTARKLIGSIGIVGAAAAVAGMGTFGTFSSSTESLDAAIDTGTLVLDLTQPGGGTTLTMTADTFVPGDSIARPFELVNGGSLDMAISMSVSPTTSSILTTDPVNGLQLGVQSCPVAWTAGAANTYTCSSTAKPVVAPAAVNSDFTPTNLISTSAGKTDYLLATLALPVDANDAFQNKSAALAVTFTGTQLTGTAR